MLRIFTILCLFASIYITSASFGRSFDVDLNNALFNQLQFEHLRAPRILSRHRRVPGPGDIRACGRKLVAMVFHICSEPCNPKEGKDIATECCSNQCTDAFIRSACCPDAV
ncbi:hypothetical protein CRE_26580 [Caenorhabditis remanei]|uniref:Uncharacterized protein n=1 Tax=Caenorhabditis remanei TaxID=31234 RepID=E3LRD8_CAERE|nr:hypothetical protein CRE_26580 [Caenorhabditis remanei]